MAKQITPFDRQSREGNWRSRPIYAEFMLQKYPPCQVRVVVFYRQLGFLKKSIVIAS
jgi:hypothetical protein